MAKYTTTLLTKTPVADNTIRFDFVKPEGFSYKSGQTIDLTLLTPPETDTEGNTRAFSLVSKPTDTTLAIATRIRDTAFKRSLKAAALQTEVAITGPFGSFTLHENTKRPAVFLAGGIGITPFYSIITDAIEKNLPHQLFLFYSNRRPEDAAFLSELQALQEQHPAFHLIATMTNLSDSSESWHGETGYISEEMLKKHLSSDTQPIYYLAGPSAMVFALQAVLTQMGISGDDIKFEEFPGY